MAAMSGPQTHLLTEAIHGDALALQRLLIPYQSKLAARIARKLPDRLAGVVSPEDVLQETFVEVFAAIRAFEPEGDDAFERWLFRIADNHVADALRRLDARKRGGGFRAAPEEHAVRQDDRHHAVVIEVMETVQQECEVGRALGGPGRSS